MPRNLFTLLLVIIIINSAFAKDYLFPSTKPPANLNPNDVPQYVCLMWEDNSFSGLRGSRYFYKPNPSKDSINYIEGYYFKTGYTEKNTLNLKQGDFGVSWVLHNLLPAGANPDGSKRTQTFHIITGQMASVTWKNGIIENPQPGDVWGWRNETYYTINPANVVKTMLAPVCWGREQAVFSNNGTTLEQENFLTKIYKEILSCGFEIGNHTLDHMAINSGISKKYFISGGEGFDPGMGKEVDLNGTLYKERFPAWDSIGWDYLAGCKISKDAWKNILTLSEKELQDTLGLSPAASLFGFRAPGLETNSEMLLALKEHGYFYDCSIIESNVRSGIDVESRGKRENAFYLNGYYPYTFDNGSPGQWYVQDAGGGFNHITNKPLFSQYPSGLWEIPVGVFTVPESIRGQVWNRAYEIYKNGPESDSIEPLDSWRKHGKIVGFDFELFIHWGMTKDDFVATLKNTFDMSLKGNKAPFVLNLHSDYFSPMFDNETLLSDYYIKQVGYPLKYT